MKKRFWVYALIGLAFGVLDWFCVKWLAQGGKWEILEESLIDGPIILNQFLEWIIIAIIGGAIIRENSYWIFNTKPNKTREISKNQQ